jgi:LexA-binding, inner membrane-associated putative hydrolase
MFIGHFAVAFAAKAAVPRTSLATLTAAAQLLDLVWPILVLLGVETLRIEPGPNPFLHLGFLRYPWTHSLLMAIAWGAAFALVYRAKSGYARGAAMVFALVVSHWVLDWITHRPDLQLAPGVETRVGLGLWHSPIATLLVEAAMFIAGLAVYVRARPARDRAGTWGLWSFVALLVVAYAASLTSGTPPAADAVAATALTGWAFIPWIAWFDRHRSAAL